MKKTLIAVAALAATGAFAQVTVSGYIDRAYTMTNNTDNTKDLTGLSSAAGTTTLVISGTENLGGGMRAGFSVATDWADLGAITQDTAFHLTTGAATASQSGTFANSQSFVELGGAFGAVRLGTINNEVLTVATTVAAPAFSTGVGSAYSSSYSIFNGIGTGSTGFGGVVRNVTINDTGTGARGIRQANTIKYLSPNFNGFTVNAGIAPKNDNNPTAGGDTVGVTDLSVNYANGPLAVSYASLKYEVGSNGVSNGNLTAGTDSTMSLLAASYAISKDLKVHAGLGTSKGLNDAVDTSSTQVGVSYAATPMIDVMAQYARVDDKASTNDDRTLLGLGADYKLSRSTRLYVRYDSINWNTNNTVLGSEQTRLAVGTSVRF